MKHLAVQSSNVASVGYDPESQQLEVTFKDGATYVYSGIPVELYADLLAAPSVGRCLAYTIQPFFAARRKGAE
jgi:hypothetical protein